jgi:hypothetical protein
MCPKSPGLSATFSAALKASTFAQNVLRGHRKLLPFPAAISEDFKPENFLNAHIKRSCIDDKCHPAFADEDLAQLGNCDSIFIPIHKSALNCRIGHRDHRVAVRSDFADRHAMDIAAALLRQWRNDPGWSNLTVFVLFWAFVSDANLPSSAHFPPLQLVPGRQKKRPAHSPRLGFCHPHSHQC